MRINLNNKKDEIALSENYYIVQMQLCYALIKSELSYGSGKNKTNKPRLVEKTVGYFQTIRGCVNQFIKCTIDDNTETFDGNLEEYVKRVEEITKEAVEKITRYVE